MAKNLGQYKNSLTHSQIAEGMNAARANANRLVKDAEILLEAKRYPSAVSLAILAIEESGKVSILRGLSLANDGKELKEAWKSYRSHTKKNVAWIFPELVSNGGKKLEDFAQIFDENSEHPDTIDHLKQIAFYTDCLGKAHWSLPSNVIDDNNAKSIVKTAKLMAGSKEHTEREIELWVKHIGPVWKESMEVMKEGLSSWFQAMKNEGLIEEGEISFSDFIGNNDRSNKPIQSTAGKPAD